MTSVQKILTLVTLELVRQLTDPAKDLYRVKDPCGSKLQESRNAEIEMWVSSQLPEKNHR